MLDWTTAVLVTEWIIRIVMIPVVVTRQEAPAKALAWLLAIALIPWIGLPLYLLVGENRMGRRRARRHAKETRLPQAVARPVVEVARILSPDIPPVPRSIASVAEHLGALHPVGGNTVEMEGDELRFVDRLVADIDAAQHHVHLLFYIIEPDDVGRRVGEALMRAARRGVTCRVLADSVGSWDFFGELSEELERAGVKVAEHLPVGALRRRAARMDLRNHRKLAVIDAATAWVGSQNLVRPDYGHDHLRWKDLSARLQGPAVLQLQAVFLDDWHDETGEDPSDDALFASPLTQGRVALQVLPTGPLDTHAGVRDVTLEALAVARRRVIMTTPYFVPDDALLSALRLAAKRGCRVDLVMPRQSDSSIVDSIGQSYLEGLLNAGVRVFMHTDGLLHAKTLTVDDAFGLLGSANFDLRSFFLNFELTLLLYDEEAASSLRRFQTQYVHESSELDLAAWRTRPLSRRFAERTARLVSPLM